MSELNQQMILDALKHVVDRDSGIDVVTAGWISGLVVRSDKVGFLLTLSPEAAKTKSYLREACEEAVKKLPGVSAVTAVLTAENPSADGRKPAVWNKTPVEGVHSIIAVASGKGGVGKSSTAVNLAHALQRSGKRIGLLDADIYGPSLPRMLGLSGQPAFADNKMLPLENYGLQCMSVGFITGDSAAIMRGPMIGKTLTQLLRGTRWGNGGEPLDILIVDMPPGTGDVHLSMAQQVPLSGAIIVTTPQDIALIDARKSAIMFQKVDVPLLGVIENMSWLEDASGAKQFLFGQGGGKRLADDMQIPLLGQIPLDAAIGEAADGGKIYQGALQPCYDAIAASVGPLTHPSM